MKTDDIASWAEYSEVTRECIEALGALLPPQAYEWHPAFDPLAEYLAARLRDYYPEDLLLAAARENARNILRGFSLEIRHDRSPRLEWNWTDYATLQEVHRNALEFYKTPDHPCVVGYQTALGLLDVPPDEKADPLFAEVYKAVRGNYIPAQHTIYKVIEWGHH